MIPYPPGTVLQDNDPRQGGRQITVVSETENSVIYFLGEKRRRMSIDKRRIYDDGKKRHQGFSLVHRPGGLQK